MKSLILEYGIILIHGMEASAEEQTLNANNIVNYVYVCKYMQIIPNSSFILLFLYLYWHAHCV